MNNPYRISTPPDAEPVIPVTHQDLPAREQYRHPMSEEAKLFWGVTTWVMLVGVILIASCAK